jgi:unsaturated pyranuronate lyase
MASPRAATLAHNGRMAKGIVQTRWAAVTPETLTPHVDRRYINTGRVTLAEFRLKKGGVVPRHSHENEQITTVLQGRLRFVLDDGEAVVETGETITLAPWVAHEVEVLEDAIALDVFAPVRADWVAGTDDYFRRAAAPRG